MKFGLSLGPSSAKSLGLYDHGDITLDSDASSISYPDSPDPRQMTYDLAIHLAQCQDFFLGRIVPQDNPSLLNPNAGPEY